MSNSIWVFGMVVMMILATSIIASGQDYEVIYTFSPLSMEQDGSSGFEYLYKGAVVTFLGVIDGDFQEDAIKVDPERSKILKFRVSKIDSRTSMSKNNVKVGSIGYLLQWQADFSLKCISPNPPGIIDDHAIYNPSEREVVDSELDIYKYDNISKIFVKYTKAKKGERFAAKNVVATKELGLLLEVSYTLASHEDLNRFRKLIPIGKSKDTFYLKRKDVVLKTVNISDISHGHPGRLIKGRNYTLVDAEGFILLSNILSSPEIFKVRNGDVLKYIGYSESNSEGEGSYDFILVETLLSRINDDYVGYEPYKESELKTNTKIVLEESDIERIILLRK